MCSPGGSGTHFGSCNVVIAMHSDVRPSPMDTTGLFGDMPRTPDRMMPCIKSPVPRCFLTRLSRQRSFLDSLASPSG